MPAKEKEKPRFKGVVDLADGRRFFDGDKVPNDISAKELKLLREMGAIIDG